MDRLSENIVIHPTPLRGCISAFQKETEYWVINLDFKLNGHKQAVASVFTEGLEKREYDIGVVVDIIKTVEVEPDHKRDPAALHILEMSSVY